MLLEGMNQRLTFDQFSFKSWKMNIYISSIKAGLLMM